MKCSDARDHLSAYLDDELEGTDREAVREHLGTCPDCSLYYEELKQIDDDLHSVIYAETDPSDRFTQVLLERAEQEILSYTEQDGQFSMTSRSVGAVGAALTLMVGLLFAVYFGMTFLSPGTSIRTDRIATEQPESNRTFNNESVSSSPDSMDSPPAATDFVGFRDSYLEVSEIEAARTP